MEEYKSSQPRKRKIEEIVKKADPEKIRDTIYSSGMFADLTKDQVKAILNTTIVPKPQSYTPQQLEIVRAYYLEHLVPKFKTGQKVAPLLQLQSVDLASQVLTSIPKSGGSQFLGEEQTQIQMANELIKKYYTQTPTARQLTEMFEVFNFHTLGQGLFGSGYGFGAGQARALTLQQYRDLYANNSFITTPQQLEQFHENINNLSDQSLLKQRLEHDYGDILMNKTIQTTRKLYPTSESEAGESIRVKIEKKYGKEKTKQIEDKVHKYYEKLLQPTSDEGDGLIVDATGQRANVPVGVVEESKLELVGDKPVKRNPVKKKYKSDNDQGVLANVKLAQKNVVRNGGQNGADLAAVENKEEVFKYNEKYPTLDEMLNLSVTRQLEFDLAQREHLNKAQIQLMQEVLSTGAIYKPNIDFLRDQYKHEPTEANLEKYNQAIISQIGKQVAYYGGAPHFDKKTGKITSTQEMAKIKPAKKGKFGAENIQDEINVKKVKGQKSLFNKEAGKNLVAPALQVDLSKPEMITIADLTKGIAQIIHYISKLSGNLDTPDLRQYEKVTEVFKGSVVKKEPSQFKPQAGQGFKVRQLEC